MPTFVVIAGATSTTATATEATSTASDVEPAHEVSGGAVVALVLGIIAFIISTITLRICISNITRCKRMIQYREQLLQAATDLAHLLDRICDRSPAYDSTPTEQGYDAAQEALALATSWLIARYLSCAEIAKRESGSFLGYRKMQAGIKLNETELETIKSVNDAFDSSLLGYHSQSFGLSYGKRIRIAEMVTLETANNIWWDLLTGSKPAARRTISMDQFVQRWLNGANTRARSSTSTGAVSYTAVSSRHGEPMVVVTDKMFREAFRTIEYGIQNLHEFPLKDGYEPLRRVQLELTNLVELLQYKEPGVDAVAPAMSTRAQRGSTCECTSCTANARRMAASL